MASPRIYLDHAATTPLLPEVREAMQTWLGEEYGNASSLHSEGRKAKEEIDRGRETVSRELGCEFGEVIFTSGGTEAANLALVGAAMGDPDPARKRILVGAAEHHCVLHTEAVLGRLGFQLEQVAVDRHGRMRLEVLEDMLAGDVLAVAAMHANNELGTVQDIATISALAHQCGALMFSDAVQTFGSEISWTVGSFGADLVGISGHKLNGPKGVGALYVRAGVKVKPLSVGGGQERELRAGTENVAAIAGFCQATRAHVEHRDEYAQRTRESRNAFAKRLEELGVEGLSFTVPKDEQARVSHCHLRIDGIVAESMLIFLDRLGVAASSGAACSSGSLEPSHVMLACGFSNQEAKEGLRFSFGVTSTPEEAVRAAEIVAECASRIRAVRASKALG